MQTCALTQHGTHRRVLLLPGLLLLQRVPLRDCKGRRPLDPRAAADGAAPSPRCRRCCCACHAVGNRGDGDVQRGCHRCRHCVLGLDWAEGDVRDAQGVGCCCQIGWPTTVDVLRGGSRSCCRPLRGRSSTDTGQEVRPAQPLNAHASSGLTAELHAHACMHAHRHSPCHRLSSHRSRRCRCCRGEARGCPAGDLGR